MAKANDAKFSGWTVLAGCFIIMFFVQGGLQTFAVFLPSIMNDTGWTLSSIALMSTVATVAAFFANMLIGTLLKKMEAKWILFIGVAVCTAHFFMYSYATSLLGLYVGAACGGISIGFGTVAPVSVVMNNWFIKKRATYMSIVIAGSMFGGAIIMPICGQLIHHFDWRVAYRILGASIGVIVLFSVIFLVADSPQKKGQKAYGADDEPGAAGGDSGGPAVADGVTPVVARSSASFWLLLVGILLVGCSTNIENFLPAFWQSRGLTVSTSSSIMGIYAFITGVCTICLGRVSDKLGGLAYAFLTSGLFIIGTISIFFIGAAATPIIIMAVIPFAAGAKKTSTLTPPLVVAASFGRKHYGAIIGYFTGMLQLGIALSNPIIGELYRSSGDYQLPFMVMAVFNAAALVLIIFALKLAPYKPSKQ
ncbi:MAG: MFS transporter [Candidatus Adiutrix sp.]|jgi:MFS family permease|nr:MFS transporter [Candidatus Adiutrix sp.]